MADGEQIFRDEPERLVGGHPIEVVEASEIYGIGKSSERTLPALVEIAFEVAHRELTQCPVHGLSVAASCVVGFRDSAPVIVMFENCDHMVGVVLGFKINYEWRISVHA